MATNSKLPQFPNFQSDLSITLQEPSTLLTNRRFLIQFETLLAQQQADTERLGEPDPAHDEQPHQIQDKNSYKDPSTVPSRIKGETNQINRPISEAITRRPHVSTLDRGVQDQIPVPHSLKTTNRTPTDRTVAIGMQQHRKYYSPATPDRSSSEELDFSKWALISPKGSHQKPQSYVHADKSRPPPISIVKQTPEVLAKKKNHSQQKNLFVVQDIEESYQSPLRNQQEDKEQPLLELESLHFETTREKARLESAARWIELEAEQQDRSINRKLIERQQISKKQKRGQPTKNSRFPGNNVVTCSHHQSAKKQLSQKLPRNTKFENQSQDLNNQFNRRTYSRMEDDSSIDSNDLGLYTYNGTRLQEYIRDSWGTDVTFSTSESDEEFTDMPSRLAQNNKNSHPRRQMVDRRIAELEQKKRLKVISLNELRRQRQAVERRCEVSKIKAEEAEEILEQLEAALLATSIASSKQTLKSYQINEPFVNIETSGLDCGYSELAQFIKQQALLLNRRQQALQNKLVERKKLVRRLNETLGLLSTLESQN